MSQKFGFELEFAAPSRVRYDLANELPTGFNLGTDASANTHLLKGFELRSDVFRQGLPRNKFRQCLSVIRKYNGMIHTKCGFHIHFSGFGRIDVPSATRYLEDIGFSWRTRDPWTRGFTEDSDPRFTRYIPIRQVNYLDEMDHYEIRVFNSTLNLRAICHYYKVTRRMIEKFAVRN